MTIRGPYEYPKYYIGLSTDIKSNIKNVGVGDEFFEEDTQTTYKYNGETWNPKSDHVVPYLWNTDSLALEVATKGVGVGASVNVENFPAVISGATVPVSGTVNVGLTSQYALKLMEDSVNPGTISYVGEAVAGASHLDPVWRIKMMDTTSGVVITWADGVNTFTKKWSDRETYDYS